MISTRVMDFKLREAAEGLGEDSTGKKKSKFKTFKKLFGKKKRKESPSSAGGSAWKQSQAKSELIAIEAGPVGYDSEDELEESRGALGGRALSHDSIFIPESGQDPARPVRVFSQENVCDRIKALQLKIQCNVKMGPPPAPGGLPAKRGDDAGMSSEDDGLPRSPPEMSLLHDIGPGTTIKVSLVSSSRPPSPDQPSSRPPSNAPACPRTVASSVAPVADFSCPPESSSCLDNSAAKHKLLVKPRNQRSSKMRRLSSRAQSECLSDLTCTPEEEESDEKPVPTVSTEEMPSAGQQAGPRGLAPVLLPGRPRARRAQSEALGDLTCTPEEEESDEKPVPTVSTEETPSAGQQPGPRGLAPVLLPGRPRARRAQSEALGDLTCTPEEEESDEKPVPTVSTEEMPSAGQQAGPRGLAPVLLPGRPRARRAQSEALGDLTCTPEEEESDEKPVPTVSTEETPSAGQQPGPRGLAPVLLPGRPRARRAQSEALGDLTCTPEEEESDEKPVPTVSTEEMPSAGQQAGPRGLAPVLLPGRPRARRAQSEALGDLTCTPEEEESDEKPVPTVSAEETPSAGQQPGPRGLAPVLPPGRPRARQAQSEALGDLTCTPEEEESDKKPVPTVSTEETPSAGQQAGPGGPAPVLPPVGPRARRVRLQHCPALSASAEEEESPPGDDPSSRQATPEVTEITEPVPGPAPCSECPLLPEDSPHPDPDSKRQREEPPLESARPPSEDTAGEGGCASGDTESSSPRVPEEDTAPPGTGPAVPSETRPGPDGPGHAAQEQAGLTLAVPGPSPEGTEGSECSEDLAPSPPASKSCLKHKAPASRSLSVSPTPPASESPPQEPTPCALDKEAAPLQSPRAEQGESLQGGAEREAPEPKPGRGGSKPRGGKKFSVASGRAWPHTGHRERPARPGPPGPPAAPSPVRLPLLRSSAAWRSEAALDDLQAPPEHQNPELEPQEPPSPAERGSQGSGSRAASQAGPGQNPPEAVATPATREPHPSAQEPRPSGDRSPFPVKLRSTSLSFKHRDVAVPEGKGVKRYSAEVRLEKGGLALLSKDDKCHVGAAPTIRGTRPPNGQGKGKARSSEQPGSKPPLPRKPLLQSLTLPYPPAGPDVSPGELDKVTPPPGPRKESRTVEKRLPRRGAEKGLPPAASGPGAEGQSGPPWITITPQKRRGAPEQPPNREDKPGAQTLKPEIGRAARAPERAQEPVRQADFIRSKSFLITPAKPSVDRRQGTKLCLQEGLQRGISLSHQNLAAQSAAMAERDLHQLKRASYASAEQPSWMELARKKSQAWSDMPQIIK